jgi:dolichyl-phosphate-mannose-protein mannosyltransferase
MGRVTYIHHYVRKMRLLFVFQLTHIPQLPTLYFSVLMLAHLLDHSIFSSAVLTFRTKAIAFTIIALMITGCFWWFKAVAFGIEGPIHEHKGLLWRKV